MERKKKAATPPVEQAQQPVAQAPQEPVDAPAPPDDAEPVETPPIEQPAADEVSVVETSPAPDLDPESFEPGADPEPVEELAAYAARIEEAAQPLPVCQITHPEAKDGGLHVGKYAGIRLLHGETPAALLSDGTTI